MITVVQIKRKIGENSVVIVITSNIPRKEKNKKKNNPSMIFAMFSIKFATLFPGAANERVHVGNCSRNWQIHTRCARSQSKLIRTFAKPAF